MIGADERLHRVRGFVDADTAGLGFQLEIVRIKNRFKHPTDAGWADMLVNFRFRADSEDSFKGFGGHQPVGEDSPYWHVCEVQFVHAHMSLVRRQMGAHHSYSKFRSAMELLEVLGE